MFAHSLRYVRPTMLTLSKVTSIYHPPLNNQFTNSPPFNSFLDVRYYAKGKEKKKDKSKKSAKIEINESQLHEVINLNALNQQMQRAVDNMREEYTKYLSLKSTTGFIQNLKVDVGGIGHELQELGQITRKNSKTITIDMVDFPQTIPDVLKAIEGSGMNLNPQQDGTTIFIPVSKVTKEHRESLSMNAKVLYIKCRDTIKEAQNTTIKKVKKKSDLSIDVSHSVQNQIVSIADKFISDAEKVMVAKQNELIGSKE